MPTPTYVSPFTGTVVQPTDVSYYDLSFTVPTRLYWPAVVNDSQTPAARIIDAQALEDNIFIYLPQANQGTVGADILIRNVGDTPFDVVDFAGAESVTVNPGIAVYFYLVDNTSTGGAWQNVTFGAGTCNADAASLQGAGLTTVLGKLAVTSNIVAFSSTPTTLNDAGRANSYVWTGGAGIVNLPVPATVSSGWWVGFRNAGTGDLSIEVPSPATINGTSNLTVSPNNSGFIYADTTNGRYFTFGFAAEVNPTFTSATYDVDSIVGNSLSLVANAPTIQSYVALSGTRTTSLTVTLPPITQQYCLLNQTGAGGYDIIFTIAGTSASYVLSSGHAAVVISSGPNLVVISDVALASFFAINGSASAPPFSFSLDSHSGMFLRSTSILGLSANSVEMLTINNTNTSAPIITTPAAFTALGGISGGTF